MMQHTSVFDMNRVACLWETSCIECAYVCVLICTLYFFLYLQPMASQQMGMGAQMGGQMPPLPTGAMPFQPAVSIFFSTIVYLDVLWMCSA
jgi:hypothetical protein